MKALLYVFIGGGLGSICRYLVGLYTYAPNSGFPLKTFFANIISCIILGFLIGLSLKHGMDNKYKLLLMTGFCGGFSTFSTFSGEVFMLIENQQTFVAVAYILASVIICTVLLFASYFLAQQIT